MFNTHPDPSTAFTGAIRIVGINTDKTRRTPGSDTNYHVYFTLSTPPTQSWRIIFLDQWKALSTAPTRPWPEAVIEGGFLLINSPLDGVAETYLPALKNAVEASNVSYKHHIQEESTSQEGREDVWKDERKSVNTMAALLHFE